MASQEEPTRQPARVIVGHCPSCKEVVVIFNNYETWPYVTCKCGWGGGTTAIANRTRLERGGKIFDVFRPDGFTVGLFHDEEGTYTDNDSLANDAQRVTHDDE